MPGTISFGGVVAPNPYAPTLLTPTDGAYEDLTAGPTFTWTYNPGTPGATQTGFVFRRKLAGGGSYEYWDAATTGWSSVQTPSASGSGATAQTITFPANQWANGVAYDWSVYTADSHGSSQYAGDITVNGEATPTVTVTAPTGSIGTAAPLVQWAPALGAGAIQIAYRVTIYSAAQYGGGGFSPGVSAATFDSGLIGSNLTSWLVPGLLANGASYRSYVQITSTGSMTSAWAYLGFTTAVTTLATPTFTVATGTDSNGLPVNTLTVTGHDTGGVVGTTSGSVAYSDDGGTTWWPLRVGTAVPLPSSTQQAVILDYDSPQGFTRDYQAIVTVNATALSPIVTGSVVTYDTLRWMLVDFGTDGTSGGPRTIGSPADGMLVSLQPGTFGTDYSDRQNVVAILSRPDPVVLSDTFGLPQLTFTLIFSSDAQYQRFESIRSRQHILLFKGPNPAGQWYIRLGATKHDDLNLPSLRGRTSAGALIIRTIQFTAQAVGTP